MPELLSQLGLQGGEAVLLGQPEAVGVQATAAAHHEWHLLLLHSHNHSLFHYSATWNDADELFTAGWFDTASFWPWCSNSRQDSASECGMC